jgi:integral membrane sensor domain MASE1/GAF domain-containing protein
MTESNGISLRSLDERGVLRCFALFALIVIAYAAGAELSWQGFSAGAAFGFPPAGVTVAALLLTRTRLWPVIVAAIVLSEIGVDLQHGLPVGSALLAATANTVEPLVGATVVRRWCGGAPDLTSRGDLLRFIAGAVTLGPLAGGLIGATAAKLASGGWWPALWLQWWAGDGIAVLVIGAPILLAAKSRVGRGRLAELGALVAVTVGLSVVALRFGEPTTLLFLPLLGMAAFRLGELGVVLTGTAFACVANYLTAAGYGQFAHIGLSSPSALVVTQAYIAVTVLLAWLLAQEVSGRERAVRRGETERTQRVTAEARRAAAELGFALADADAVQQVGERVSAAVRERTGADHVVINVLSADKGRFEQLAGEGMRAQSAVMTDAEWTIDAAAPGPRAARDRRPVYVPDWSAQAAEFADAAKLADDLGLRAAAHLPLLTEVGPLGYLGLWWREPHLAAEDERQFLEAMAETTSRALERARLREAERAEQERIATLSELTSLLAAAVTADAIGEVVSEHVRAAVGQADGFWLGLLTDDHKRLERIAASGPAAPGRERPEYVTVDELNPTAEVLRTGEPLVVRSAAESGFLSRYNRGGGTHGPTPSRAWAPPSTAWIAWPLRIGESTVGIISFVWRRPQSFSQGQLSFVAAVADLIAQALVRARLYDDEHAALTLLRRVVRPAAKEIPGLEVASIYRQAGPSGAVGGDWYDAVELPTGGAFLSIGDVVGHGFTAAQDMSQLRHAARTLAVAGLSPGRLLQELGRVAASMTAGQFATAAVGISDADGSRLVYACAGHPPMLLRRARTGEVRELSRSGGPALGPFDDATYAESTVMLDHGDIVLMYTDGLIERPGEDLHVGIARVARELSAWNACSPLPEICDKLVATLAATPQLDDICVLAVRRGKSKLI